MTWNQNGREVRDYGGMKIRTWEEKIAETVQVKRERKSIYYAIRFHAEMHSIPSSVQLTIPLFRRNSPHYPQHTKGEAWWGEGLLLTPQNPLLLSSFHSPITIKFQWTYFPPVHPLRTWGYLLLIILIFFPQFTSLAANRQAHKLEKQLYRKPRNCSSFPNSLKCCLCLGHTFLKKSLLAFLWHLYRVTQNCFAVCFLPPGPNPAYALMPSTGMPLCFSPLFKLRNDIPTEMKPWTEYSNCTKLTRIHRLWQCSLTWNWLQVFLHCQFFAILKQCVLPLLNSQRKSKSASSSYFRKYSATGNIFFQTLTVNLCHCFRIWHPVHQFRGNLYEN